MREWPCLLRVVLDFCQGGRSSLICPRAIILQCPLRRAEVTQPNLLFCAFLPPALTSRCLLTPSVFFMLPRRSGSFPKAESLPSISDCAFWAVLDTGVRLVHSYAVYWRQTHNPSVSSAGKKNNKCLSGELDVAAAVKSLFSFLLMCVPKLTLRLMVKCVTVSLATTAASSQGGREPI